MASLNKVKVELKHQPLTAWSSSVYNNNCQQEPYVVCVWGDMNGQAPQDVVDYVKDVV